MSEAKLTFDFSDMAKLEATLKRTEKIPQKAVTRAAGKGRTVVRRAVRSAAPVWSGDLQRGIISVGERSRLRGKKVYDITFDPNMNDVFQRPVKEPGAAGSTSTKGGHAYYPASMEYGFLTRSKGGGYSYFPGYHFMRDATEESGPAARHVMIETFTAELEKEWQE